MRLILLGPPGAGKGTQAAMLARRFDVPHISTGDILREAVASVSALGVRAKSYMDKGELAPDALVMAIVAERLGGPDCKSGFILDGFPRTVAQAKLLDDALKCSRLGLDAVINFETSERTIIERLSGRRLCSKCQAIYHLKNMPPEREGICDSCGGALYQRTDDGEATVRRRLRVYNEEAASLTAYYKKSGLIKRISGDLDAEEVFGILMKELDGTSVTRIKE